jgi:thiamine biosynthesis lipoprotein
MNIYTFEAMGTHFQFVGVSDSFSREMEPWIRMVETSFSRFDSNSEVSLLNHSPGMPVRCSVHLWEIMQLADYYYRETEGIFHPYLGSILNLLGYDRSFEQIHASEYVPSPAQLQVADHPISLNTDRKEVTLHPAVSVDLGGIAKGWSAQKASEMAKRSGILCGLVDAGGDMVIWGNEDAQGWDVFIENPWDPKSDLAYLRLNKEVGIATSNSIKRQWGEGRHHIIDPRILQSSQSDLIQVTIIAPDLTLAEVYTKVFMILGLEQGIHMVEQKQVQLAYLLVRTDGTVCVSSNIGHYASEWYLI